MPRHFEAPLCHPTSPPPATGVTRSVSELLDPPACTYLTRALVDNALARHYRRRIRHHCNEGAPPMLPEAETCLTLFDNLRRDAAAVLAGLPPEALNWRPLEGGDEHATNSIAATL